MLASTSGQKMPTFSSSAPSAALATNRPIDSTRRQFLLSPPAIFESAKMAVKVTVITLVARSGTPCVRTMAFCKPIAKASSATTAWPETLWASG